MSASLSVDELLAMPAVVDVPTAGRAYGIGERLAYELARRGDFPVPVLTVGRLLRVRRRDLLADLAPDMDEAEPASSANATTAEAVKEPRQHECAPARNLRTA